MACDDCLEVYFVGLVAERICVWCLVIITIFMGCLKSHQLGVAMQVTNGGGGSFHRGGRFSLCNTAVL